LSSPAEERNRKSSTAALGSSYVVTDAIELRHHELILAAAQETGGPIIQVAKPTPSALLPAPC
jgi:hypothetical protein